MMNTRVKTADSSGTKKTSRAKSGLLANKMGSQIKRAGSSRRKGSANSKSNASLLRRNLGDYRNAISAKIPEWSKNATRQIPDVVNGANAMRLKDYVVDSPLLLGVIGLGVGAIAGALLPNLNAMSRRSSTRGSRRK
jgi:hypothetical protein